MLGIFLLFAVVSTAQVEHESGNVMTERRAKSLTLNFLEKVSILREKS
jgi:hypothetical protein